MRGYFLSSVLAFVLCSCSLKYRSQARLWWGNLALLTGVTNMDNILQITYQENYEFWMVQNVLSGDVHYTAYEPERNEETYIEEVNLKQIPEWALKGVLMELSL